jgi:hypothetical protein
MSSSGEEPASSAQQLDGGIVRCVHEVLSFACSEPDSATRALVLESLVEGMEVDQYLCFEVAVNKLFQLLAYDESIRVRKACLLLLLRLESMASQTHAKLKKLLNQMLEDLLRARDNFFVTMAVLLHNLDFLTDLG